MPLAGLLVLSAWCLGVLNSHHRFLLSYSAPIAWNLAMIATLVAYGPTVSTCLDAATVAAEEGRSLEVIDLRSLAPLDRGTILSSVRKTGRAVVVHEASTFLGLGAEISALVTEEAFYHLEAPEIGRAHV